MRKLILILVIVCTILIITNCSRNEDYLITNKNGISRIHNFNKPINPNLKIDFKKVFTLKLDSLFEITPLRIVLDSKNNFYILDMKKCKIHKFNSYGKSLMTFGGRGNGPGEFRFAGALTVNKDTIIIPDLASKKLIKFSSTGRYLSDYKYENIENFPAYPIKYGDFFINISTKSRQIANNEIQSEDFVRIYDNNLKFKKLFYSNKKIEKSNTIDLNQTPPYVILDNHNHLVVANQSYDKYEINFFTLDNQIVQQVTNLNKLIPFDGKFKEMLLEKQKKYGITNIKGKYQNCINDLQFDKYDRLWVLPAQEANKRVFDVYEKGILQNKINIIDDSNYVYCFKNDFLLAINNHDSLLEVFTY